jgi:hypothetical protein
MRTVIHDIKKSTNLPRGRLLRLARGHDGAIAPRRGLVALWGRDKITARSDHMRELEVRVIESL